MKCDTHGIEDCLLCEYEHFPLYEEQPSYAIVTIVLIAAIGFIALLVGEYWV